MNEGERGLLLVHLDIVQKGQEVDHAVTEKRKELEFWRGSLRIDSKMIDKGLQATKRSKMLKECPQRCQQDVLVKTNINNAITGLISWLKRYHKLNYKTVSGAFVEKFGSSYVK